MDLSVSRARSGGRDVLRVCDARTEQEAGRYDRSSGRLVVADQARVYEVVQALWDFLAGGMGGADDAGCLPRVDEPRPGARDVLGTSGPAAACEACDAPDAAGARDVPGRPGAPGVPGEPGPAGAARPAADRPRPADPYTDAAPSAGSKGRGGRLVDRRLGRLRRDGWAVLSPGGRRPGADFDRLVIGPPGVFAITVTRGGDVSARALRGPEDYDGAHDGRHDAQSAARMLSAASGMPVKVTPMLAFVGADADTFDGNVWPGRREDGSTDEVLIARGEDIADVLWGLPAVYSIQERKQISDVARQAGLWRAG